MARCSFFCRVATDQIWDTEQFTGLELQKKYRISFQYTKPFTEQIWRFKEKNTEFPKDLKYCLQNKFGDLKKKY